jgi:hypothetical protein
MPPLAHLWDETERLAGGRPKVQTTGFLAWILQLP